MSNAAPPQFSLRALFWLMLTLGMALAYARTLSAGDLWMGLAFGIMALAGGSLLGGGARNLGDGLFWSLLVTMFAFLSIVGVRMPNQALAYGWGAVGAMCGALCGVRIPRRALLGAFVSGGLGIAMLIVSVLAFREPLDSTLLFDLACAGLIGGLLRVFVEIMFWFEARSGQPRYVIAAWLTLAVIGGNLLVPYMAGVF